MNENKNLHLWQIEHPYYCAEGNYFEKDLHSHYDSWKDFLKDWGSVDPDHNLVWRFDWKGNMLTLFYMLQRKAYNRSISILVHSCNEDEIKTWLIKKWEHLQKLWTPFSSSKIEKIDDEEETETPCLCEFDKLWNQILELKNEIKELKEGKEVEQ